MKILIVAFISLTLLGSCTHHSKPSEGHHANCADCSAGEKTKSGTCKECADASAKK